MKSGRKDHKNRLLRAGESQDKEGRYRYSYYENGKQKSFYSWNDYYGAAEPPVRCGVSHLSGPTEPPDYYKLL